MSISICFVIFCCCLFVPLTEYFFLFSDGTMVDLLESEEDEDDDAALVTRR